MVSRAMLLTPVREVLADQHAGAEAHALRLHLLDAAVDQALFHLEVGNAVAQQAADAVALLEHRHLVAGARQLLGGGQAGGAGADDATFLPVFTSGGCGTT
jgi:hypothetical protein